MVLSCPSSSLSHILTRHFTARRTEYTKSLRCAWQETSNSSGCSLCSTCSDDLPASVLASFESALQAATFKLASMICRHFLT